MFQQYNTALIALSPSLQNQNLLQLLSQLKVQVINKIQINTKENLLLEVQALKPNFLLFSTTLPGVIELTEVITKAKQVSQKTKLILIVNENDSKNILRYLFHQADAIISTQNLSESLEGAIKQLTKGLAFICGKSVCELRASLQEENTSKRSNLGLLSLLTEREIEVLHSLTQGINYKQTSKLLFISESTVKTHINNIFTKLNVNDRTQAVLYALYHGIESVSTKPHIIKNLINEPTQARNQ